MIAQIARSGPKPVIAAAIACSFCHAKINGARQVFRRRIRSIVVAQAPRISLVLSSAVLALAVAAGNAQSLVRSAVVGEQLHLLNTDKAVLSSGQRRTDFPCSVTPLPPQLGFDLEFLAGYLFKIPLSALAGEGTAIRVLFRVQPLDGQQRDYYFSDRYTVPPVEEGKSGDVTVVGRYKLGPGRYQLDWLMRDGAERVCSTRWQVKTPSLENLDGLAATGVPYFVAAHHEEVFEEDPPVPRARPRNLLHLKLLVNFTPTDFSQFRLREYDLRNIVSILRAIAHEPRFGTFSLVAFNMQEERLIFDEQNAPRIDFPALGDAVRSIRADVVDVAQLQDRQSGIRFLTELLQEHLGAQDPEPDAVIIVGPKTSLEGRIPRKALRAAGRVSCPVFYLVYDRIPQAHPWRDAISNALRVYRGREYAIAAPKDLGRAMNSLIGQVTAKAEAVSSFEQGSDSGAGRE